MTQRFVTFFLTRLQANFYYTVEKSLNFFRPFYLHGCHFVQAILDAQIGLIRDMRAKIRRILRDLFRRTSQKNLNIASYVSVYECSQYPNPNSSPVELNQTSMYWGLLLNFVVTVLFSSYFFN